jgi:hypothetical protein
MAKARTNKDAGDKIPQKKTTAQPRKRKKKVTTQERVKQHFMDEDDIITDQDLKEVHLDLGIPKDEAHEPLPITNDTNRPKDEDKDNKQITPWDVISE